MAVFGAESPLQLTGDLQRDIETIRNYIYERDMELRHVLSHLDESNFTEGVLEQPVTNITNEYNEIYEGGENEALDLTKATGILPVEKGGTGASDVTAALQKLGLMAKVGEVINLNHTMVYHGYLSSDATAITFTVPLPRLLPPGMTGITVESLAVNMRKPSGGYIGSSASYVEGGEEYIGNSNYTVNYLVSERHAVLLSLVNNVTSFDSDNNVPISIVGTLRLKVI